ELHPVGYLGEQGEVRPGPVIRGSQRVAVARPYGGRRPVLPISLAEHALPSSHTFPSPRPSHGADRATPGPTSGPRPNYGASVTARPRLCCKLPGRCL